jgi:hypothetical protein
MKTGTTFLQELLMANQEHLADAGYLFPGTRWAEQSAAARDILGFSKDDEWLARRSEGKWAELTEQMLAHRGTSIFSMEFLSYSDTEQATRILESLEGAEVHVIITVRDAASTIPAQWQTSCRNAGKVPLGKFIRGVRQALKDEEPKGRGARMFQRTQGIPRMLEVWQPLVGDRLHVITVPPRGSDPLLLWHRFAGVVGVDPAVCSEVPPPSNQSLGHASAELLRQLNMRLGDLTRSDYDRVVKGPLSRFTLGTRAHLETPVKLHRSGRALAARWNRRVRKAIVDSGVDLIGDLDDLSTRRPDPEIPQALHRPSAEDLLEAAATARDGLIEVLRQTDDELTARRAGQPVAEPGPLPGPLTTTPQRWADAPDPVAAALHELETLVRSCLEVMHTVDEVAAEERLRLRELEQA